jgi:sirohydrochlorin cobaltochelatase
MSEAIILVGHGSRDPEGVEEFRQFAAQFHQAVGVDMVKACFLEFADPAILDLIEHCVQRGATQVTVLPLFLVPAGHQKNDVPSAVQLARLRHPAVTFRYGAPLGVDARLLEVLDERLAEVEQQYPAGSREETAVLLVGRGSGDPDGNSDVFKIGRLLWEGRGYGWVEVCFVSLTHPSVPEGIARCVKLGAKKIMIVPYFLFTGILVKRIVEQTQAEQQQFPDVELLNARHLGGHAQVLAVLQQRFWDAVGGRVYMNCDVCKYRVALPGFAHQVGQPQTSDHHHGLRSAHHHHHGHGHGHSHS